MMLFCRLVVRSVRPALIREPSQIGSNHVAFANSICSRFQSDQAISRKNPLRKKQTLGKREPNRLEVTAYSTAEEYNLESLSPLVETVCKRYQLIDLPEDIVEDAIHFRSRSESGTPSEAFVFREGSVVFWNVPEVEQESMLALFRQWSLNPYNHEMVKDEKETLDYSHDEQVDTRLRRGSISLNSKSSLLEQYAFSNALSLSVKLAIWEMLLQDYVEGLEPFAKHMKECRKIGLTEGEVFQKTGQLFALRHDINLRSDLLDTPDFYWDRENLEKLFHQTCATLNIQKRVKVMNEKLNHCCDLMGLLNEHLKDKHHTRLEWMIIILIMVEVGFECIHYYDRYYSKSEDISSKD
ncbi:Required for meiotic nuclear division protein 1 -like protein [Halotydeus destructor]|nr:Required for meiotic nuclear division protein 1 -like protein [Halotydeus destructor]